MRGREIWAVIEVDKIMAIDRTRIVEVRRVLPIGPVGMGEPNSFDSFRQVELVQLYCDPGGMRTLAAASVFLKAAEAASYVDKKSWL